MIMCMISCQIETIITTKYMLPSKVLISWRRCECRVLSFGIQRFVVLWNLANILEGHVTSILGVDEKSGKNKHKVGSTLNSSCCLHTTWSPETSASSQYTTQRYILKDTINHKYWQQTNPTYRWRPVRFANICSHTVSKIQLFNLLLTFSYRIGPGSVSE
jgi:hypothetical protein